MFLQAKGIVLCLGYCSYMCKDVMYAMLPHSFAALEMMSFLTVVIFSVKMLNKQDAVQTAQLRRRCGCETQHDKFLMHVVE